MIVESVHKVAVVYETNWKFEATTVLFKLWIKKRKNCFVLVHKYFTFKFHIYKTSLVN